MYYLLWRNYTTGQADKEQESHSYIETFAGNPDTASAIPISK
jgi:hypothetical protein